MNREMETEPNLTVRAFRDRHSWEEPRLYNRRYPILDESDAVYIGRPTKWGNPLRLGKREPRGATVSRYEKALLEGRLNVSVEDVRRELRGRDLVCWCVNEHGVPLSEAIKYRGTEFDICHGMVLLRVANG